MEEKVNSYVKMEAVENYLQSVEIEKYTPFTVDFIEEWVVTDKEDRENMKECVLALEYEVDNILRVMNPAIEDYKFFVELQKIVKV